MAKLIGSLPQQVPTNADLGTMAYLDAETEIPRLIGGRKNLIINGDFQVWQRGTVGTAVNGFAINSADRWYSVRTQLNQETDSYGNPYAHCVCGNWADSNYIQHKVEFPRKLLGKTLTLSFWIKSDDGLGDNGLIYIRYYTGSGYETPCLEEFTFGTEWKKIVATFNMPTTPVANDNYGLEIFLEGNDSTTNHNGKSFDIKEVQLELGSVATPFEHRSYGEELALCQRYYFASESMWLSGQPYGTNGSTDGFVTMFSWPTTMRSSPAVTIVGGTDGNSVASLYTAFNKTTGVAMNLRSNDSTTNVWYSNFKLTADAEL